MNLSRAEVVALLKDVGEPPGKELEYRLISGAIENVGCLMAEHLGENVESFAAWHRLRECLFWARRSMGLDHALASAGLDPRVTDVTQQDIVNLGAGLTGSEI